MQKNSLLETLGNVATRAHTASTATSHFDPFPSTGTPLTSTGSLGSPTTTTAPSATTLASLTPAGFAGIWERVVNYEPRGTVQDTKASGSTVVWCQSPDGMYIDVRNIISEDFPRGFAGVIEIAPVDGQCDVVKLTWNRWVDTKPESCPGGVDSAIVRRAAADVLMEEGDGYLEVWHRIGTWHQHDSSCSQSGNGKDGVWSLKLCCAGSHTLYAERRIHPSSIHLSYTHGKHNLRASNPAIPHIPVTAFEGDQKLGFGGHRGSTVRLVRFNAVKDEMGRTVGFDTDVSYAMKEYSHFTHVSANELDFCARVHKVPQDALRHIVAPQAVLTDECGAPVGILMPVFSHSLYDFLHLNRRHNMKQQLSPSSVGRSDSSDMASAFRSAKRIQPCLDPKFVMSVAYQIVHGLHTLSYRTPHNRGFVHNDLGLRNVLLQVSTGRIALCDFELVSPMCAGQEASEPCNINTALPCSARIPAVCYQAPWGLGHPSTDVWCLGLLVLEMITGVIPLFDKDAITDDFSSGPLLKPYHDKSGDENETVLDWEGNIQTHVLSLLPPSALAPLTTPLLFSSAIGWTMHDVLALCGECLVNRPKESKLRTMRDIFNLPTFDAFKDDPTLAESTVVSWIKTNISDEDNDTSKIRAAIVTRFSEPEFCPNESSFYKT